MKAGAKPIILDNWLAPGILGAVAATWPAANWPHWHRYDDANASKLASKDAHRLPDAARLAIADMARLDIAALTGIPDAFVDLDLHGAGLHLIPSGGHLGLHLDGAVHPLTGWKREANAVLFIDAWKPEWGGNLEFFESRDSTRATTTVEPRLNRLVLFATGEENWHRVAKVTGPNPRRTISLFWWSAAESESRRDRAEFVDREFHRQPVEERGTSPT